MADVSTVDSMRLTDLTPHIGDIPDRQAFVLFVHRLRDDYLRRGEEWENRSIDRFLEALAGWIEDSPGWYSNFNQNMPESGDWTLFARALDAATAYE